MKTNRNGYYNVEIDLNKLLSSGCGVDNIFYIKDLQQRKLFLNDDISPETVEDIVKHILQFNTEDYGLDPEKRRPILLYLSSDGGDVDAGFELIDVICSSKTPVYTINLGYQYSMGFLIGIAGHKRFAMPNAKFLMHDGSNFVYSSTAKAQDQMEFQKKVEQRVKTYIMSKSKIAEEEYDSKYRVEWYFFADEAKEKRLYRLHYRRGL